METLIAVWYAALALSGFVGGLLLFSLLLMLVGTVCAALGIFVNKPSKEGPSGVHFFTFIGPGEVKIIVRGKKPIRMVTNTSGKRFAGIGNRENPEHWALVSAPNRSEDPTAGIHFLFRWWAKLVYKYTGAVFTGLYPIQRVLEYKLERTAIERKEEGRVSGSNLILRVNHDVSDHFRTRQFLFPVHITEAETKDKIPLDIIGVAELETTNPHKAAFGTDRWDHAIINLVTDAVTDITKTLSLDQALTAATEADVRKIASAVEAVVADQMECGIDIRAFRILEINPALEAEGLTAIQSEALSAQRAKGMRIEGSARADNIRAINEANAQGGEHALATMQMEGTVRAAEAAGKNGGSVILMTGQPSNADPTQLAILTELKKLNTGDTKK